MKPDFFSDAKIVQVSSWARLLFIGMWVFADDEGLLWDDANQLRLHIFPDQQVDVAKHTNELVANGLVDRIASNNGRAALWVRNFNHHQKVPHPSPSKIAPLLPGWPVETPVETPPLLPGFANSHEGSRILMPEGRKEVSSKSGSKYLKTKTFVQPDLNDPTAPSSWPVEISDVKALLDELDAPRGFYNPVYWQQIHAAYAPHPDVFYLDELRKYVLWWHRQPTSKRRKVVTRSFTTWLRTEEARAAARADRKTGGSRGH